MNKHYAVTEACRGVDAVACPPFTAADDVVAYGSALAAGRLQTLVESKARVWKAYRGYKTGVSLASGEWRAVLALTCGSVCVHLLVRPGQSSYVLNTCCCGRVVQSSWRSLSCETS